MGRQDKKHREEEHEEKRQGFSFSEEGKLAVGAATSVGVVGDGIRSAMTTKARTTTAVGLDYEDAAAAATPSFRTLRTTAATTQPENDCGEQDSPCIRLSQQKGEEGGAPPQRGGDSGGTSVSVTDAAVSGAVELIKRATGVTLQTATAVAGPTAQVLVPALWQATTEFLSEHTSVRLQDWFRIVKTSVQHLVSVMFLRQTDASHAFRTGWKNVGLDLLECCSCPASRQVIVDSAALTIKILQALHTPETRAALEQWAVQACRVLDALAPGGDCSGGGGGGHVKLLAHDVSAAIWRTVQLAAHPDTVTAVAEVTAFVCHALEQEHAILHRAEQKEEDAAANSGSSVRRQQQQERRHERDAYQQATYVRPTLAQDPTATVEQVILSSLGCGPQPQSHPFSPTYRVVATKENTSGSSSNRSSVDMGSATGGGGADDESPSESPKSGEERLRRSVNVSLLREQLARQQISNVSQQRQEKGHVRPSAGVSSCGQEQRHEASNDSIKRVGHDVEDAGRKRLSERERGILQDKKHSESNVQEAPIPPRKRPLHLENEEEFAERAEPAPGAFQQPEEEEENRPPTLKREEEDSSPVHCFYQILDEILLRERNEKVRAVVVAQQQQQEDDKEEEDSTPLDNGAKKQQQRPKAARVVKRGTHVDTIQSRLGSLNFTPSQKTTAPLKQQRKPRNELEQQQKQHDNTNALVNLLMGVVQSWVQDHKVLVGGLILFVVAFVLTWIAFGCYGVYVFFFASSSSRVAVTMASPSSSMPLAQDEIVIRLIRQQLPPQSPVMVPPHNQDSPPFANIGLATAARSDEHHRDVEEGDHDDVQGTTTTNVMASAFVPRNMQHQEQEGEASVKNKIAQCIAHALD